MRSTTQLLKFNRTGIGMAGGLALLISAGCGHFNNPWKDSSAIIDTEMSTVSSKAYLEGSEADLALRREGDRSTVFYANTATTHWPLYLEDPFEDQGNREHKSADCDDPDIEFRVSWVDYMHILYGPGRMFVNLVGFPISAIETPPARLMESDGRLGRRLTGTYDARKSNWRTRQYPDVSDVSEVSTKPVPDRAPNGNDVGD